MVFNIFGCTKSWGWAGVILALSGFLIGCVSHPTRVAPSSQITSSPTEARVAGDVDQFAVVHCLLPGQIRRLGTHVTYLTARRPVKTTAEDCAIRGGEYVAADRANYSTALKIWLEPAKKGEAEAQYYVGTLFEKGATGTPDYLQAVTWYEKAANQGYPQAAMNLGRLYEKGLGVQKNPSQAFKWYTRASGMDESSLSMLINEEAAGRIQALEATVTERQQEIERLQDQLDEVTSELNQLQEQLREGTTKADEERQALGRMQQHYQQLRGKLDQALADPEKAELAAQYETELRTLKVNLTRAQHKLEERDNEIARLQERIASLETEAVARTQQIQAEATGRIQALEKKVTALRGRGRVDRGAQSPDHLLRRVPHGDRPRAGTPGCRRGGTSSADPNGGAPVAGEPRRRRHRLARLRRGEAIPQRSGTGGPARRSAGVAAAPERR